MVTGIGTEVGKTLVSAIITQMLEGDYWKPVESGELELDSVRMSYLLDASRHRIYPSAYSFKFPLSPHHAARLEGKFIDPALYDRQKRKGL
ncbi:MAG: dethiobiotin synthase [Parachlamydiaceae bacterium]|nr:MAG: dethiobiotin synthase [Parachlamydiaceae bacterium]